MSESRTSIALVEAAVRVIDHEDGRISVDFVPTRMWFRLIELLPGILVVSAFGAIGVAAMVGLVVEALGGGYRDGLDWLKLAAR